MWESSSPHSPEWRRYTGRRCIFHQAGPGSAQYPCRPRPGWGRRPGTGAYPWGSQSLHEESDPWSVLRSRRPGSENLHLYPQWCPSSCAGSGRWRSGSLLWWNPLRRRCRRGRWSTLRPESPAIPGRPSSHAPERRYKSGSGSRYPRSTESRHHCSCRTRWFLR